MGILLIILFVLTFLWVALVETEKSKLMKLCPLCDKYRKTSQYDFNHENDYWAGRFCTKCIKKMTK